MREGTREGNLLSGRGIGEDLILEFLKEIPGIHSWIVREQLANLRPTQTGHCGG